MVGNKVGKPRSTLTRDQARSRNRERGGRFEKKVAGQWRDGVIWRGEDGDVIVGHPNRPRLRIEAKYRTGLTFNSLGELRDILDQVGRYVREKWPLGTFWAVALTGGRAYRGPSKSGTYYLVPAEWFVPIVEHYFDTVPEGTAEPATLPLRGHDP